MGLLKPSLGVVGGVFEPRHLNAHARECSAVFVERGQRFVRYHGEEYLMVGLYFARGQNGERELFYILRSEAPDGRGDPTGLSLKGGKPAREDDKPSPSTVERSGWRNRR